MDRLGARVMVANRNQIELRAVDLEGLLAADHRARLVWAYVERLNLSPLYEQFKAVEGHAGRPGIDPAILLALWLYATLEGVGSARALARLCEEHDAYRWICGGVGVNYHSLADFRVGHGEFLDRLLTTGVASLMTSGAVTLQRVTQDGVRVRASAGAPSFRRRPTLERCLAEAKEQVARLRQELDDDPGATSRRQQAARERAACERAERVEQALAELNQIEAMRHQAAKKAERKAAKKAAKQAARQDDEPQGPGARSDPPDDDKKRAPRASTTDPEARVMKGPDGGFRASYNVQFATDAGAGIIVGVDVTNQGADQGQLSPMGQQLKQRYGRAAQETVVDGGFVTLAEIAAGDELGTTVYAPVPEPKNPDRERYQPLRGDPPAVAAWRVRMGTQEAKDIYRQRAATAEWANAQARNRGLRQFAVRGRAKVKAVALLYALAHNLLFGARLAPTA